MRDKAQDSGISTDHIIKREKAMFTRVFVFMYLFLFTSTSAETQPGCTDSTVTRSWFGDRIVFYNYAGTCNKGVNPCKQLNGVWRNSVGNCSCRCLKSNGRATYREDLKSCVKNQASRDGCTLLFSSEQNTNSLRVFNKSSSLKLRTLPRENCRVTGTAYVIAYGTAVWKQFKANQMPFYIRHQDRKRDRHDHFLEWKGDPVAELFGKIVKADIECQKTRGRGGNTLKQLCIVFKVKGTINLPCPVATTSSPTSMTTIPKTTEPHVSNQTTKKPIPPVTDVVIVTVEEPNTTPDPSIDEGNKQSHDVGGKKGGLPIWLIAVVAGGAVIATLCITVIIWLCWKMKRRSHKRRTTRRANLGNPLFNPEDDTGIMFAPSGRGPGIDEAGYATVVNPTGRKGYAHLKPASDQRSRSEYQKLLKPTEDRSGYLVPLEEVTTATGSPSGSNIYSEAQSPKPPQNKPKSKEYDYAKPEGIIVLTASRSSLDNLDSHRDADSEPNEADYVETRQHNGPSSPLYAVVEGPSSPLKSPGVPPEGAPMENELNDPAADYIEVLPDTENVNKDSET